MSDSFASDDVVDIMAAFLSVFQGPHLRQLNWCLRSPQLLGPLWDPLGYLQRGAFQLLPSTRRNEITKPSQTTNLQISWVSKVKEFMTTTKVCTTLLCASSTSAD